MIPIVPLISIEASSKKDSFQEEFDGPAIFRFFEIS